MRSIVAVTCMSQLNGIIKIDAVAADGRGICKFYPGSSEPADLNKYIQEMMFCEDPFIPNLQDGKIIVPAGTQLPQNFNQNVGQITPVQMQAQAVQHPVMQAPVNQQSQSAPTVQEPAKRGPGRPKSQPTQQQQVSPTPMQPVTIQQQPMLTQQPHPVQQQAQAPIQQVPQQMPVQQAAPAQPAQPAHPVQPVQPPKPTGTKALPDPEASHCIKGWINEAMQGQPIPAYLTACLEQMKQILSTGNEGKPYPIIIDGEENVDMKVWVIDSIRNQLAQAAQNPQQLI